MPSQGAGNTTPTTTDLPIVVGVVAHPSRRALADRLAATVEADCVAWDTGHGPTRNHLHAWGAALGLATRDSWIVVLEDDAMPVNNFRAEAPRALAVAPTPVTSFYLGTGAPEYIQPRFAGAIAQAGDTASWITATRLHHAVAVAIRTHLVTDMLGGIDPTRPIDQAIGAWCAHRGHRVAYTAPSLVDHLDVEPTITGRRRATRPRKAWKYGPRQHWTPLEVQL